MPLLEGQFVVPRSGNPLGRILVVLLFVGAFVAVFGLAIVILAVALPFALIAWGVLTVRRWLVRRPAISDDRVNVRVRIDPN